MGSWWMRESHMCLWHNWSGFPSWDLLLPLHPGSCPLCEGCLRLWLWFLPSPQICSWFTAGKSHAPTQLQFNKGQISLPATLPFPLPSLSLLRLQLKFNITQQFLVPQHVSTPSILMACNVIVFLSTQPQHLFLLSSFFFFPPLHFGQALRFFLHDINRKQTGPSHSLPKTFF